MSDQLSFYDKEIPSILFTTGRFPEYQTHRDVESIIEYEPMERELEYIYNYTVSLCNGPRPIFNAESEVRRRADRDHGAIPYYDCDRKPSFLGSADPRVFLEKWVYQYVKYPAEAVRQGIQGRVLVDFVIDESGKVTDVTRAWIRCWTMRPCGSSVRRRPGSRVTCGARKSNRRSPSTWSSAWKRRKAKDRHHGLRFQRD